VVENQRTAEAMTDSDILDYSRELTSDRNRWQVPEKGADFDVSKDLDQIVAEDQEDFRLEYEQYQEMMADPIYRADAERWREIGREAFHREQNLKVKGGIAENVYGSMTKEEFADFSNIDTSTEQGRKIFEQRFLDTFKVMWKDRVVTHKRSENSKWTSDLDGNSSLFLISKIAGLNIGKPQYVSQGDSVSGKINIDTGNEDAIGLRYESEAFHNANKKNRDTGFIDHHGQLSNAETSATQWVYEMLEEMKLIKDGPIEITIGKDANVENISVTADNIKKFVDIVTCNDNKNFPDQDRYYENYATINHTMIGLLRFTSPAYLLKFIADGRDLYEELTEEDLLKYNLLREEDVRDDKGNIVKGSDGRNQKHMVNYSEVCGDQIARALQGVKEKIDPALGFAIKSQKLGKVFVDLVDRKDERDEAAKSLGFDTYLLWNYDDKTKSSNFFITSKDGIPFDFSVPEGHNVRGRMIIKDKQLGTSVTSLLEILKEIVGPDFEPTGELKAYIEKNEADLVEVKEERENIVLSDFDPKGRLFDSLEEFKDAVEYQDNLASSTDRENVKILVKIENRYWRYMTPENTKITKKTRLHFREYDPVNDLLLANSSDLSPSEIEKLECDWYLTKDLVIDKKIPATAAEKIDKPTPEESLGDQFLLRGEINTNPEEFVAAIRYYLAGNNWDERKDRRVFINKDDKFWLVISAVDNEATGNKEILLREYIVKDGKPRGVTIVESLDDMKNSDSLWYGGTESIAQLATSEADGLNKETDKGTEIVVPERVDKVVLPVADFDENVDIPEEILATDDTSIPAEDAGTLTVPERRIESVKNTAESEFAKAFAVGSEWEIVDPSNIIAIQAHFCKKYKSGDEIEIKISDDSTLFEKGHYITIEIVQKREGKIITSFSAAPSAYILLSLARPKNLKLNASLKGKFQTILYDSTAALSNPKLTTESTIAEAPTDIEAKDDSSESRYTAYSATDLDERTDPTMKSSETDDDYEMTSEVDPKLLKEGDQLLPRVNPGTIQAHEVLFMKGKQPAQTITVDSDKFRYVVSKSELGIDGGATLKVANKKTSNSSIYFVPIDQLKFFELAEPRKVKKTLLDEETYKTVKSVYDRGRVNESDDPDRKFEPDPTMRAEPELSPIDAPLEEIKKYEAAEYSAVENASLDPTMKSEPVPVSQDKNTEKSEEDKPKDYSLVENAVGENSFIFDEAGGPFIVEPGQAWTLDGPGKGQSTILTVKYERGAGNHSKTKINKETDSLVITYRDPNGEIWTMPDSSQDDATSIQHDAISISDWMFVFGDCPESKIYQAQFDGREIKLPEEK